MITNAICKAFLLTAALFTTSFAKKKVVKEDVSVELNEFSNTATFIGGPVDGIVEGKSSKCEIDIDDLKQYAIVSEKVFDIEDVCKDNYVVALATNNEDVAKYPMIKARIVESSENCNDAQIILNKETYDQLTKNEEKADIIWTVVDKEGNIKLKVNYEAFNDFDDFVGIPAEEIQRMFEQSAKDMVKNDVDAQGYPWEEKESGHGVVFAAASVAAAAGLVCFVGYKAKSKRAEDAESSLAIPDLPPLDTTVNTVTDHPEGLPRVDIYNPPLEFYHFPMDTSYDIVDIRPDFYD
jgi:hypothetical protein